MKAIANNCWLGRLVCGNPHQGFTISPFPVSGQCGEQTRVVWGRSGSSVGAFAWGVVFFFFFLVRQPGSACGHRCGLGVTAGCTGISPPGLVGNGPGWAGPPAVIGAGEHPNSSRSSERGFVWWAVQSTVTVVCGSGLGVAVAPSACALLPPVGGHCP